MSTTDEQHTPPRFLVGWQLDLAREVLDRIIPSDRRFPGAGELGVAGYIDKVAGGSSDLGRLFLEGLSRIATAAGDRDQGVFADLTDEHKDGVLRAIETEHPRFFQALVKQAYNGYYTNPKILALLGLEARPPQPSGYDVSEGDLSPLERVKRRGQAFRDV